MPGIINAEDWERAYNQGKRDVIDQLYRDFCEDCNNYDEIFVGALRRRLKALREEE